MPKALITGLLALTIAACSNGAAKESADANGAAAKKAEANRTLADGAQIDATMRSGLTSRTDDAGKTVEAIVSHDVNNSSGTVVIPAGSTVQLTVVELQSARDQGNRPGRLSLAVNSVNVDGTSYPVAASIAPVKYSLVGRGVTKDEAARIGVGTAVGAVAGQVIGKNTKSTVIGGAVGTVAGAAVAVRYAERDVVVAAGTPVVLTLTQSLRVPAK